MQIRLKQLIWQWHVVLITASCIAGLVILIRLMGWLQPLEWAMYDQYFCWRPQEPTDPRIVLVQISQADLAKYSWPVPDGVLAKLITKLNQQHPRAIGLDLYRSSPIKPEEQKLIEVFQAVPTLIGIEKVRGRVDVDPIVPAKLLRDLDQVGANDAVLDADRRLRRGLLYLDDKQGKVVLSLPMKLALIYLQSQQIKPSMTDRGAIKLGRSELAAFESNDGAYVRTNSQGFQILLNYRGSRGHFRSVSLSQVLENQIPADLVRDRIVLIGSAAESVSDYYATPFSSILEDQQPQLMSGVEIIANLTSQILSAALEERSGIRVWSKPTESLWILVWATVGATISWQQRTVNRSRLRTIFNILLSGGILVSCCYWAFLKSWWIPVVPPLFALLGSSIIVTGYIAQFATEIRRTFGRYLTDEVVTSLLETPAGLQMGGEKRKITVVMSDLRGFSAISERLPPEQVVRLLNLYLEAMTEIITQYGGLINQVIGDGMVIFFGALNQKPDDAERGVACAIAMQLGMETVNQRNQSLGLPTIEMGIGINTGEVIVGNIGSLKHAQFTAIGRDVNLAARIESSSVGGQVLVSQILLDEVPHLLIRRRIKTSMKGMQSPVIFYEVGGIGGTHNLFLPSLQSNLLTLREAMPIQYMLVEGKQLVGAAIPGHLIKISRRRAVISSEQAIAPLSDIRITLTSHVNSASIEDIYAKVTDISGGSPPGFLIHFTNISPHMVNSLLSLVVEQSRTAASDQPLTR
jgi:adenylate cyclase